jgi:hypothetical protein
MSKYLFPAVAAIVLLTLPAGAKTDRAVAAFFEQLVELSVRADAEEYAACFDASVLRGEDRDTVLARFATDLRQAKLVGTEVNGDVATLRFRAAGDDAKTARELLLRRHGDAWLVTSTRSYVVAGTSLEKAQKQPQKVRLIERTTNGPYGNAAFSFVHVTGDPSVCKNRMNLWFCHNGDFHARGIVDAGAKKLDEIDGIPPVSFSDRGVRVESGHAYVVHCRRSGTADFFVKLRVTALRNDVVEFEWTLLSEGPGAPADLTRPVPEDSSDGADGCDGLCGKNG